QFDHYAPVSFEQQQKLAAAYKKTAEAVEV
ncbi:MAG: hypothetical protein RIR90_276, partial [Bacteroidota bacterium]